MKKILIPSLIVIVLLIIAAVYMFAKPTNAPTQNFNDPFLGKWWVSSVEENGLTIVASTDASIEFLSGTYKSSAGCNEMAETSYNVSDASHITFQVSGTKKKCPKDVVDFWDLNHVTSYELSGKNLSLNYTKETDEGSVSGIFKLSRAD